MAVELRLAVVLEGTVAPLEVLEVVVVEEEISVRWVLWVLRGQ